MATSQQFLVCDNSTLANFKSWAQAISTFFGTAGWLQSSDAGQVNWSTIASVPTSGNFVYEIWKPGDGLTPFYVKMYYGTGSGSPAGPRWRWQTGTGTDGAGNLTGFTTALIELTATNLAGAGITTYECDFSGDTDRMSILMWRTLNNIAIIASFERTKSATGTNTTDGYTVVSTTQTSATATGQQTVIFGVGAAPALSSRVFAALGTGLNTTTLFNNNIPVSPVFPVYGQYGNPMTTIAFVSSADVTAGSIFSTSLFGSTRAYIAAPIGVISPANSLVAMRYD